eukprot:gene4772-5122_t
MKCICSIESEKIETLTFKAKYRVKSVILTLIALMFAVFTLFVHFYLCNPGPGHSISLKSRALASKASYQNLSSHFSEVSQPLPAQFIAPPQPPPAQLILQKAQPPLAQFKAPSQPIPVYYVNLKSSIERRQYTERLLTQKGFSFQRVEAFTAHDVAYRVKEEVTSTQNIIKPNIKEIACIASHLHAMWLAVNDNTSPTSSFPYALIIEDDVKFEFDIDWVGLIEDAPKDFTILQLVTSNYEMVDQLWKSYSKENTKTTLKHLRGGDRGFLSKALWQKRDQWKDSLWSTQAYIIHKERVRQQLFKYVTPVATGLPMIKLVPPSMFVCRTVPCMVPFRIVADIYIYLVFSPSYVSRIPLFNGAASGDHAGIESYIQSSKAVEQQIKKFDQIHDLVRRIINHSTLLPSYLHPIL